MLRKTPKKNIDDIQDIRQMLELFGLLHIEHDPNKLDLSEMKETAKKVIEDQSSGSGKYSNGTTVTSLRITIDIVNCFVTCIIP